MVPDEYFSPEAPMGIGKRFIHDCSNKLDKPLVVTRVQDGYKFYCHRCGEKGVKSKLNLSPSEWQKWKRSQETGIKAHQVTNEIQLPEGFTPVLPEKGLVWLYSKGLTDDDIKDYSIGYSPIINRVVFPVYSPNGELIYWTGRTLGELTDKNPKWNNVKSNRKNLYFRACPWESVETVVLVEDIISAIRVSHSYNCYALLSAFIPDELILELSGQYTQIFLWLDPNKRTRMLGRVKRWRGFGVNILMVRSEKDPKYYSDKEIEEKLGKLIT